MRVQNASVQNFYNNVLNRRGPRGKSSFEQSVPPKEPCKLAVEQVEKPLDMQAEGAKAATESLGVRARMNPFTDELQKLFGTDISDENKLNMDSSGGEKLTQAQIKDLRDRYNVENLSPQDKYDLMAELTDLGVISGADAVQSSLSMVAMPTVNGVPMMVQQGNGILNDSTNFLSNLQNTATRERESYDYMEQAYGKRFDDVKAMAESHQRLYDVLSLLMK